MDNLHKGLQILKRDGLKAAAYAALTKYRDNAQPQRKYDNWIQKYEYQLPVDKCFTKDFDIQLISVDKDMWQNIASLRGDYIAFCYGKDYLTKEWEQIIKAYIKRHNEVQFIYSDEDFFYESKRRNPILKPEWSIDTYLSYDYIGGLIVLKKEITDKAYKILSEANDNLWERYGQASLYALGLCISELILPEQVGHLKRILYHRINNTIFEEKQLNNVKCDTILRRQLNAFVEVEKKSGQQRIVYQLERKIKVSVIIPSKNQSRALKTCIESAEKYTDYSDYEWIIVDNGSNEEEKKEYENIGKSSLQPYKYIYNQMDFNYSMMNNIGAAQASGECLIFMNDDIEFIRGYENWMDRMVAAAMQAHIGAVGAKLLYPNSTKIQHIGVINYRRGADHVLRGAEDLKVQSFYKNCLDTNVLIVTGALMAVERVKYDKVNRFNEELKVTYNDVDFCLKLYETGYYNIVRTDVCAYHHESLARGKDADDFEKYRYSVVSREILYKDHSSYIGSDPFYHPYLSQTDKNYGITTSYLPMPSKARKINKIYKITDTQDINFRIDEIRKDEWLYIRGFAYKNKPGHEKISIILQGLQAFRFDTHPILDHTFSVYKNDGKSYAFAGFECMICHLRLPKDNYHIFIKIDTEIIDTHQEVD